MARPAILNIKENKTYFKDYYHTTKEDFICECGAFINNHSLRKHLKTKKHSIVIDKLLKIK